MRVNTSWAFVGNIVYSGCQWAVLILLLHMLPQEEVGQFAYGLAITGPIFVFASVRLRHLLATGVPSPGDFVDYLTTRCLTTGAAFAASIAIGALSSSSGRVLTVVAVIAFAKGCDAVSEIAHGLFQRELDMRAAAVGLMVNGIVSVLLVALSLVVWPSLLVATGAYASGSLVALTVWDLPRVGRLLTAPSIDRARRPAWSAVRRLLAMALPLGLSSAVGSVQSNLPRYVVASSLGPGALAIFAAVSYIPLVGHLAVNATAQAALPLLAREARTSGASFQRRLTALVAVSVGCGVLLLATMATAGPSLLGWIYGAEYSQHAGILLWLMAASAVTFTSVFLGTGTTASGHFGAQLIITCTSVAVVALSISPLVHRYGLTGAAMSLLAGATVELAAYIMVTARILRESGREHEHGLVAGALAASGRS